MRLLMVLVSALLLAENIAANFGYLHRDPHSQIPTEKYWSQFKLRLLGASRLRRAAAEAGYNSDHDPRAPHHEHIRLFDYMMTEINKGHITADKLSHWWTEIHAALNSGDMTTDEFHQLVNALIQAGVSGASHEGCCPLG